MRRLKTKIYYIIEKAEDGDVLSKIFDISIMMLILCNILAIILQSHATLAVRYKHEFYVFELASVMIFSIEYLLRLWTADIKFDHLTHVKALKKEITSPFLLIDLLAILPFYLPMIIPFDLRFLRVLRLTRVLRIFKLHRYSFALNLIGNIWKKKKDILLSTIYILMLVICISSVLMYYAENEAQPEKFSSITATLWWAFETLTTVGYGDIYPTTPIGKILAGIIGIVGIGIVALPTGILSSGFIEELRGHKEEGSATCPHCGKTLVQKEEE